MLYMLFGVCLVKEKVSAGEGKASITAFRRKEKASNLNSGIETEFVKNSDTLVK
jgi:hypothetical protein